MKKWGLFPGAFIHCHQLHVLFGKEGLCFGKVFGKSEEITAAAGPAEFKPEIIPLKPLLPYTQKVPGDHVTKIPVLKGRQLMKIFEKGIKFTVDQVIDAGIVQGNKLIGDHTEIVGILAVVQEKADHGLRLSGPSGIDEKDCGILIDLIPWNANRFDVGLGFDQQRKLDVGIQRINA